MKKITAISAILFGQMAMAQNFTPGNVVVARLGDGNNTVNTRRISLVEYDPSTNTNTPTNTVTIPYTDLGNRLTVNPGVTGAEGGLSLSADGRYLVIGGGDVAENSDGTTFQNAKKSFARIGYDGVPTVFTMNSNVANGFIRSSASYDGDWIYFASDKGLGLIKFNDITTGTVRFYSASGFINYFNVIGNHLYGVSTANPAVLYNFDLPISTSPSKPGGEALTALTGPNATSVGKAYGFVLLDQDNTINNTLDGNDVLYIADQSATPGIVKMYYNTTTSAWTYLGKINAGGVITGLTAKITTDGKVELYAVRGATLDNELIKITDNNSRDEFDIAQITSPTILANAGAKYTFRSVALSPSQLSVLPLNLISFKASLSGNNAILKWVTNNEANVKEFVVEKSTDGKNFSLVKSIAAKNQVTNTYNLTDWNIEAGTIYYRLKLTDIDGAFTYSHIQTVTSKGSEILSIYPNPATDNIVVTLPLVRKGAYLRIYNVNGKVLKEVNLQLSASRLSLPISDYPSGQYVVTVFNGQDKYSCSFVK